MKVLRFLIPAVFTCMTLVTFSQETVFPLDGNKSLMQLPSSAQKMQRQSAIVDTVTLPFIEDFSLNSIYPTDTLWLDSNVYVNNNYSESPVTIGVATFDGLNKYGRPYHPGSIYDSVADYLTSRPIKMEMAPGDSNAWLSFYYQPQGLGDIPEPGDSLILQLKDTSGTWNTVWKVAGRADTAFQRVNIQITDLKYFFSGFQFRFYNIATTNGNRDHWHLDYVVLKMNTVSNTPIIDFGFLHPLTTLLNEYTAMPYSHYKYQGIAATMMKTTIADTIRNFDYGPSAVAPFVNISDTLGLDSTFTYPQLIVGLNLQSDTSYEIPLAGFQYPIYAGDSMEFLVKSFSDSPINQNKLNDSSFFHQRFWNYYAYDDGSAEAAIGVTGSGNQISSAVQFDVKMQDTLRGVQIYFNPTGTNVANKLFQLTVWSDINATANTSVEMYRMINQKPDTFDGINVFKTYLFDTTLVVGPGNIWVGMVQNDPQTLYGVGLDKNTDSHTKTFVRINGFWSQSTKNGTWMMRPVFGHDISLVGINEADNIAPSLSLFPNPANNTLHLKTEPGVTFSYIIYNTMGSVISEGKTNGDKSIDVSSFAKGMYVLKVITKSNQFSSRTFVVN